MINIQNWLVVRAVAFQNALVASFMSDPGPHGGAAQDAIEAAFTEALESDPVDLVMQSELYRALEKISTGGTIRGTTLRS